MTGKRVTGLNTGWAKPTFSYLTKSHKKYKTNFNAAMLYVHYEMSAAELKKEVIRYVKSVDPKHPLLDDINTINENRIMTYGKYMYILNHGGEVPDDVLPRLIPELSKTIALEKDKIKKVVKVENVEENTVSTPTVSIQDRLLEKTKSVAAEIEGWIDEFTEDRKSPVKTVEDFVNLFKTSELKAPHMRYMHNIFERRALEISDALSGSNKDLSEAYSNFSKPELKKLDLFHKNILDSCNMLQQLAKATRAPRKKKPVSQEKLISKLKYKKEDTAAGIASVNPIQLLSAKEVWIYNTKTRKLSQYKALDERGLSIKGTSIINYSSDSVEKTLRKPAETLSEFKKASKVKLRTFLKDLSTVDTQCNGKLNEHCVILRADR